MSQHKFTFDNDGRTTFVMAGWDRPLCQIFLLVEDYPMEPENFDSLSEEEQEAFQVRRDKETLTLYDNGLRAISSVEALKGIMLRLGLPIPAGFLEEIEKDRQASAGNRIEVYEVPA